MYLRLTKTGNVDAYGCEILELARHRGPRADGRLFVVSGQAGAQVFRRQDDPAARPNSLEPIPEGRYTVGGIEWRGGEGDYSTYHSPALGPVWVSILHQAMPGGRGAFGFHLDANRSYAPGSAGCVVFTDLADLQTFVGWLRAEHPTKFLVDWGLGLAETPAPPKPEKPHFPGRIWANANGQVLELTERLEPGQYLMVNSSGPWGVKLVPR